MIDFRTLFFADLVSYSVFSVSLTLLVWRFRRIRGLHWFTLFLWLTLLKIVLQSLRGRAPVLVTLMLGNQVNSLAFVCMFLGFYWFCVRRRASRWLLGGLGLIIFVAYPICFSMGIRYNFAVGVAAIDVACVMSIAVLLRSRDSLFRFPAVVGAFVLSLHLIVLAYRTVLISFLYDPNISPTHAMSDPRWLYSMAMLMGIDMALPIVFGSLLVVEMQRTLHREATTDPLTGVLNRRALLNEARARIDDCRRSRCELALLVIDVDEFKHVNDKHGHAGGDSLLISLVQHLKRTLPSAATLARSGGEEFAVLLPSSGLLAAYEIAERLRLNVEQAATMVDGQVLRITVSVGLAAFSGREDSWEKMLRRADAAMYLAKEGGRNCVCVDQSEPTLLSKTAETPAE